MAFKSLLLSKDADLVQTLSRLLKDLDIAVEPCSEPFAAAKRLMDQHFDAILVDCEDEQGAGWVLQSARMATASKKSITIAIVGGQSASRGGPRAGENFVIQKPIVLKQVESTLRAARGLMGDVGVVPRVEAPVTGSGVLAERPPVPVPAPVPHVAATGQGRPPAELFDELTAALDRLGPQAAPAKAAPVAASSGAAAAAAPAWEKPELVASSSSGAAAAAAPAWEKPGPPVAEPASPRPEPLAPPVLRPAQQAWPGLASPPTAAAKPEVPAVLPLAATSAEMKPSVRPAQDQVRSNNALDDVRRRMSTAAPPAWRTDVEERQEPPAPRFSTLAIDEPRRGFPFKAVAVAMVLVSLALFAYSWYRGRNTNPPANGAQAPVTQPQPTALAPSRSAQEPAAVSSGGDRDASAAAMAEGSSSQDTLAPAIADPKPSKTASEDKTQASVTAPDTTTDVGLPPAPLVVEGGRLHSSTSSAKEEVQVKPPSLAAVANAGQPGLGVMSPAALNVPKLAAPVPQRIKVSQGVTQGLLVRQVKPQYPTMARETRVEGDVVLAAVIGKDGTVRDLKAVSGPAMLIASAIQAVRQWRYKPYLLNGEPVEVETEIKLQFRL